jgi:glutamate-5-semialdehyde dehydrogenase
MTETFSQSFDICRMAAQQAQAAASVLATISLATRNAALTAMAQALQDAKNEILEANTLDLEASREMAIPEIVQDWLKLTPERLQTAIQSLDALARLGDPLQGIAAAAPIANTTSTYACIKPLGVIAFIYEALPELGVVAAGLCLKSGNSLLLRGTSSASHSNQILTQVMQRAIAATGLPTATVQLLPADDGSVVRELISQDQWVDLVIPYGRPSLIQQVVKQAAVPVLPTAMGNCYLYWSSTGNVDHVRSVILDSHQGQPDQVNAIEKVLVNSQQNLPSLIRLWDSLRERDFKIRADQALVKEFPELALANPEEWGQSYLSRTVSFKWVDSLPTAIDWTNHWSSGHADCIITESYSESRLFASNVKSALVYINSSPRFYRSFKPGEPVYLGMSNLKRGDRSGLIGLKSLTTTQQIVQGSL